MNAKSILFFLLLTALVFSACARAPQEKGILEGHVTIGPLTPVTRLGDPEPTPNPAVYADRAVVVYKADGKSEVARLSIDTSGNYRAELPTGTYVVDINHAGIDNAADLPREITITSQEITRLDIDIDTGIR